MNISHILSHLRSNGWSIRKRRRVPVWTVRDPYGWIEGAIYEDNALLWGYHWNLPMLRPLILEASRGQNVYYACSLKGDKPPP